MLPKISSILKNNPSFCLKMWTVNVLKTNSLKRWTFKTWKNLWNINFNEKLILPS